MDVHLLFRDDYMNLGIPDKDWKCWKIFNKLKIEEVTFNDGTRRYVGERESGIMQGFGIFEFLNSKHRYEGEFFLDNFDGYGVYVWQRERQYYEGEWRNGR